MVLIHAAVGQDHDIGALLIGFVAGDEQPLHRALQRRILVIQQRYGLHVEAFPLHGLDLHQIRPGEDRVVDLQDAAVLGAVLQQVAVAAEIDRGVRNAFLADGVDGGIRDLGELLLEVIEERRIALGQHRQRHIRSHGGGGLLPGTGHGQDGILDLLVRIAEGAVQPVAHFLRMTGDLGVGDGQVRKPHQILVEPLPVGLAGGVAVLDLPVLEQKAPLRVDQQHLARAQPVLADDARFVDIQHSDL